MIEEKLDRIARALERLADEPAKDVDIPGPTLKENGEKFTSLTVDDLDAAEVGSKVSFSGSWLEKDDDGTWMGVTAQDVISMSPGRTLTPPEKPEPPTEPGAVVLVTGYSGAEMPEPIPCIYDTGHQSFVSTDWAWNFQPDQITGWRKARIVVEGEE